VSLIQGSRCAMHGCGACAQESCLTMVPGFSSVTLCTMEFFAECRGACLLTFVFCGSCRTNPAFYFGKANKTSDANKWVIYFKVRTWLRHLRACNNHARAHAVLESICIHVCTDCVCMRRHRFVAVRALSPCSTRELLAVSLSSVGHEHP
jgi:hypothetical protein